MRMLVIGAGAIGGYYGARLAHAGRDVTFLVRARRAAQLEKYGLVIKSPRGDYAITPKLVAATTIDGPYDVVLVAIKAFSLEAVLGDMAQAIGPGTMILAPLNGMKHVEVLSARFGARSIMGCVCKIAVELDTEGRIIQLNPQEDMAYGEMDGGPSTRARALNIFMQDAGFPARLSPVIAREMWEKWILLAGLGGINCLMRGTIGEVENAPGGVTFANALLDEIIAVVTAVGIPPTEEFVGFARKMLTAKGSPITSSMYRDLTKGAPIEADQIIGDLLARGTQAAITTPLLETVYTHLAVYENARAHSTMAI